MDGRRRNDMNWLEELDQDVELRAVGLRVRRALPLVSPSPEYAQALRRELVLRASLMARTRQAGSRSLPRPLLVGAAVLSLLGAAFYLWQNRPLQQSLAGVHRKP